MEETIQPGLDIATPTNFRSFNEIAHRIIGCRIYIQSMNFIKSGEIANSKSMIFLGGNGVILFEGTIVRSHNMKGFHFVDGARYIANFMNGHIFNRKQVEVTTM